MTTLRNIRCNKCHKKEQADYSEHMPLKGWATIKECYLMYRPKNNLSGIIEFPNILHIDRNKEGDYLDFCSKKCLTDWFMETLKFITTEDEK